MRAIERECAIYLASLVPLRLNRDERLLVTLAFYGGCAATLRIATAAEPVSSPHWRRQLQSDVLDLTEKAAGVR